MSAEQGVRKAGKALSAVEEDGPCSVCGAAGSRTVFEMGGRELASDFFCGQHREERDREEDEQRTREDESRRRADARRRFESRIARAGVPPIYQGLPVPDGHAGAVADARRWVAGEVGGLLLTGDPGRGKTFVAGWAAWQRLLEPREVVVPDAFGDRVYVEQLRWATAPLLFAWLSQPFESEERQSAHRLLTGRGPLVIDDLDKVRPTEYAAEQMFLAIDNAVSFERPLIVTVNQRLSELAERWPSAGPAIASRLAGYCEQHVLDGPDRRLDGRRRRVDG